MLNVAADAAPAARSSMDDVIDRYKQDVDLTLIRDMLRRPAAERFELLRSLLELAEEMRRSSSARRERA